MENYIYIVECKDHTYYTGWTNHLEERIVAHNQGLGAKYTKSRTPVHLVYHESYKTKQEAQRREYAIKRLSRKEKEALIGAKKKRTAFLFDLDGTLTNSGEGIIKSVEYALKPFGIRLSLPELKTFVGPPLQLSFKKFGVPDEDIEEAIALFRERYLTKGKFENEPYPGIPEMLAKLDTYHHLYVATSKPETTAKEILDHFNMSRYFDLIAGASFDHSRENKDQVIQYLLDEIDEEQVLMIGDTKFDVLGAKKEHIPTVGVSWGYGKKEELEEAGAIRIVDNVAVLYDYLKGL